MMVVVYMDAAGQWRWRLKAKNGRIVADGGEGYKTKRGVLTACDRMAVDANMSASRVGAAFCIPFTVDGKLARVAKR